MWIRRIKSSLTAKIFLITAMLLSLVCALTYGFVAWFMPISYTSSLTVKIDEEAQQLLKKLESCTAEEGRAVIRAFEEENHVSVYQENASDTAQEDRNAVSYSWVGYDDDGEMSVTVADEDGLTGRGAGDEGMRLLDVRFQDGETARLWIMGGLSQVNQAVEALNQILPWLVATVLSISVLAAFIYARYITRPIVRLSGVSRRMAELELDWQCGWEGRADEIGVLSRSLNQMSGRLSQALEELKGANRELKKDIERERLLEKQRIDFFRAVSHELKTPITVLKGQLEGMLYQVGIYRDREKYLRRSLAVAGEMEGMVRELLEISRVESQGFEQKKEAVELESLIRKSVESCRELWQQKQQTCRLILPDAQRKEASEEGYQVYAVPSMIRRVLDNLMSNAILYSPIEAQIRIWLWREAGRICLRIENTGVWIPEDSLPRLFEAFYRVEKSRNRNSGGTGLGLYLVKTILDQYGAICRITNTVEGVAVCLSMAGISTETP